MSQHINLLTKNRAHMGRAWLATCVMAGVFAALIGWIVLTEIALQNLKEAEEVTQQTMAALRIELADKQRLAGLEDAQALAKESAAMRVRIDAQRDVMDLMKNGELGRLAGYSAYLKNLATIKEQGVWVQRVEVTKAGQSMLVAGNALDHEAVMRYASQLNQSFKDIDIRFFALEISKDDSVSAADAHKSNLLKFKLY